MSQHVCFVLLFLNWFFSVCVVQNKLPTRPLRVFVFKRSGCVILYLACRCDACGCAHCRFFFLSFFFFFSSLLSFFLAPYDVLCHKSIFAECRVRMELIKLSCLSASHIFCLARVSVPSSVVYVSVRAVNLKVFCLLSCLRLLFNASF